MIEDLNIRRYLETRETSLSPFATQSQSSRGRETAEKKDSVRTAFQHDRDRILHTKAFRRLKHKTQVFIAPPGDHYTTRLTHTLEVSQIARTIARALCLNEDLTEAISLGHDLGHTPFGHIGEDVLNRLYSKGFRHNEQSLRVVEKIEKDGHGLNLTWEVRDGILHHSKNDSAIFSNAHGACATHEAEIVKISDAIAYINHDINDAIRAGLLGENDIPSSLAKVLGRTHGQRINTMVCDIIASSWSLSGLVEPTASPTVRMSQEIGQATEALRKFMFDNVYRSQSRNQDAQRAQQIVHGLFEHLVHNPKQLPLFREDTHDTIERMVVDFIAGMTDQYAINLACNLGI